MTDQNPDTPVTDQNSGNSNESDLVAKLEALDPEQQAKVAVIVDRFAKPKQETPPSTEDIASAYAKLDDQAKLQVARQIEQARRRADRRQERRTN